MAIKCSWCNVYIVDKEQYWTQNINVNGKIKKSEQKFCSPKCSHEYVGQLTPEKSGCFVATAVYEDYDHPVVLDLRFFRDNYLDKNKWGKTFIIWYYTHSPGWANIITRSRALRLLALIFIVKPLHFIVKFLHKDK